jgi:hypothetical protein
LKIRGLKKNKKTNEDLLASFLGEKKEAFPLLQETKKIDRGI